ncbi:chromate transporter [Sporolactobacillus shoreicorticis]|uniref:Chromate transporter n=1 Tax=Sporolactobacillus shoreicorticis TaxID=1923877 RepID=A0ABW5S483_9BACL|nr:chromate transporter [Sporolactobacillus shoreicorticis]MCO7127683.1 chromate transporter [Sporolactobacillus shoreicorticis]
MILWKIFLAFFIPGILGYGGGPASIPLIENEVVGHYHWMTVSEFSNILAFGNALPGPIATKMAGYIGYEVAGIPGALVALFATIAPSLILLIALLKLLERFKDSPKVKWLTLLIRPIIVVMLGMMAYNFFATSLQSSGWLPLILIAAASFVLMQRFRIHPAFVIAGALAIGAIFMG